VFELVLGSTVGVLFGFVFVGTICGGMAGFVACIADDLSGVAKTISAVETIVAEVIVTVIAETIVVVVEAIVVVIAETIVVIEVIAVCVTVAVQVGVGLFSLRLSLVSFLQFNLP
jgi:amino acid permease